MGIPMALQFSITGLGTMIVQASLNLLGSSYIAAFSAANKVQNIIVQVFPSLGVTMATFAGQNAGAGRIRRIKKGMGQAFFVVLGGSVVCALIIYFLGDSDGHYVCGRSYRGNKINCKTDVPYQYVVLSFFGDDLPVRNVLQGLGDGFVPMLGGVFELFARWLAIALLAAPLGYVGICMADPCAWVSALIPLIPVYFIRIKKLMRWDKEGAEAVE